MQILVLNNMSAIFGRYAPSYHLNQTRIPLYGLLTTLWHQIILSLLHFLSCSLVINDGLVNFTKVWDKQLCFLAEYSLELCIVSFEFFKDVHELMEISYILSIC